MEIKENSVVQINEHYSNPEWIGCLMQVDEVKNWGVCVSMKIPVQGITCLRVEHGQYDLIGQAVLIPQNENNP